MPTPNECKTLARAYYNLRKSVIFLGPPGGGKSACFKQVAQEIADNETLELYQRTFTQKKGVIESFDPVTQFGFFDVRLAMLDAVDGRGIPVYKRETNSTEWPAPGWLPRGGCGILFLDEFMQGLPLVMNAFSQLVYDGTMGEYVLPPGWSIVMASNREQDRSGANRMPAHLANKIGIYEFETSLNEWMDWAFDNDIMPEVVGLIKSRPALLHAFDANQKSFPSPRSWELASEVVKEINAMSLNDPKVPPGLVFDALKAHVGEGAAVEASAFMEVYDDLPRLEEILKDPAGFPVPRLAATIWATVTMIGDRTDGNDFDNACTYIGRFPEEYKSVFINYINGRKGDLSDRASFKNLIQNADLTSE